MPGLAASFLAGFAALVASQVGDADYAPFFIGLTFLGGVEAWSARKPSVGVHRTVARLAAAVWLVAATWVALLWLWYLSIGGDGPPPGPLPTYLGVEAAVYYLAGLYGGAVCVAVSGFGPVATRRRPQDEGATASGRPRTP